MLMRYGSKVALLLVLVAVVPVAAVGFVSAKMSHAVLEREVLELQQELARTTAAHVNDWLSQVPQDLQRAAGYLPFTTVEAHERTALLRVLYQQLDYVSALVLVDAQRKALTPPVFLRHGERQTPAGLIARYHLRPADERKLADHIPVSLAIKQGEAFGPPYVAADGSPRMTCAIKIPSPQGPWVLAAEVNLQPILKLLKPVQARGLTAGLLDTRGRAVISTAPLPLKITSPDDRARTHPAGEIARDRTGKDHLLSLARVPLIDWSITILQPAEQAFGAVNRLFWYSLLWTGACLFLAIFGGITFSRGVTRPVRTLSRAARQMQQGDYKIELEVPTSGDELAALAHAFAEMAAAVRQSHEVIAQQKHDLELLNRDLQKRVEEKTRNVHDALEQVIRSQKAGALGELSAGIAHELNNPLTSILGLSQLMRTDAEGEEGEYLDDIADQARRMQEIIKKLSRFAQTPQGSQLEALDINTVCCDAIQLARESIQAANLELRLELSEHIPPVKGDPMELQQAFSHLISNAVQAMKEGDQLCVKTQEVKGAVAIEFQDTGHGIPEAEHSKIFEPFYSSSKSAAPRPGLGLAVVDRIIHEHQGQVTLQSTPDQGSIFTIYLPGLRTQLHLK